MLSKSKTIKHKANYVRNIYICLRFYLIELSKEILKHFVPSMNLCQKGPFVQGFYTYCVV